MMSDLRHDTPDHLGNGSFRMQQLVSLPFDSHQDPRSFVHVGDFDTSEDRIKQELNTDGIHLPHTLPQPDPYYHHSHDPSLHFPLSSLPYPYLSTHTSEHYAMQHYQPQEPSPPPLPSPVVSHEYSHEYQDPQSTSTNNRLPPIKGQRKSRWRPTLKQREKLEACWAQDQYPDRNTKQAIAAELEGVTAEQVSRWFKHRRESFVQKGTFQYRNEAAAKFSNEQVALLEAVFKANAYPSREEIKSVAESMLVSQQRVKNWFKARRCRLALRGEFEFKQNATTSKMNSDRKRKGDSPLPDEPYAKRNELQYLPSITDGLGVDDLHHSHISHDDSPHLPHLSNVHMHSHHPHSHSHVELGSLHGPLVDHILSSKEHHSHSHSPSPPPSLSSLSSLSSLHHHDHHSHSPHHHHHHHHDDPLDHSPNDYHSVHYHHDIHELAHIGVESEEIPHLQIFDESLRAGHT